MPVTEEGGLGYYKNVPFEYLFSRHRYDEVEVTTVNPIRYIIQSILPTNPNGNRHLTKIFNDSISNIFHDFVYFSALVTFIHLLSS